MIFTAFTAVLGVAFYIYSKIDDVKKKLVQRTPKTLVEAYSDL